MDMKNLEMDMKMQKKLQVALVTRLVALKEVQSETYQVEINELYHLMEGCLDNYKSNKAAYHQKLNRILDLVKKEYGLVPKGSLVSSYMSIGMAIGVGIGVALNQNNPGMYSIGIGAGLALGAGIGNRMEKEKEKEGKLF